MSAGHGVPPLPLALPYDITGDIILGGRTVTFAEGRRAMMTFTTFIPKARNDGSAISRREINSILRSLRQQFGGYTMSPDIAGE